MRLHLYHVHPNTGPGPPWASRNTPRPKFHAHWRPCHRSQKNALGLGLLFRSIQSEQNSGPITWLREPPRTGDGPTPQPSLRGTTGRASPTRVAPGRPFPPRASVPAPSPRGSFSLPWFQFISSHGSSVPLTYNPSFCSITDWVWIATPPPVDPVLVKLSAKALWSPW